MKSNFPSSSMSGLSPGLAPQLGSLSNIWAPDPGIKTTAALVFGPRSAGREGLITPAN